MLSFIIVNFAFSRIGLDAQGYRMVALFIAPFVEEWLKATLKWDGWLYGIVESLFFGKPITTVLMHFMTKYLSTITTKWWVAALVHFGFNAVVELIF